MRLSDVGESRVNGYLFVLERSLKSFLPPDVVRDAVREIESHVRERVESADGSPNERAAVEQILTQLGPPLRVAQAYSTERTVDEAVATGHVVPIIRAVGHLAISTVSGFFMALWLLVGYLTAFCFVALAALKPIFPANVGVQFLRGYPVALSAHFPLGDADLRGGYWVIPIALVLGLAVFVGTQRGARRFLSWWRERRVS